MNGPSDRRGRASLPSVDAVLRSDGADAALAAHGRRALVAAVRAELDLQRTTMVEDAVAPDAATLLGRAVVALHDRGRDGLRPVINATGVVVHTNLGRAPLSESARDAVVAAAGYATVEYDLASGSRGSRTSHVGALAAELCGAAAGTAVNNGAAALLLAVAATAAGREVIVSRGELVEIGGSFRLPDIIAASGADLVEVGTTNRTRMDDYRRAIGPRTALLLKVHRSNFRMVGFTEDVSTAELVALASEHGLISALDAGSGLVDEAASAGLPDEPEIRGAVAAGADLVLFSGDKLLGGPQAGIIVGSAAAVERCRRSPLARALRIDKLQIAALEATLRSHLRDTVPMDVPAVAMLHADPATLQQRAEALAAAIGPAEASALDGVVGGGAAAGVPLASYGVRLPGPRANELAALLRAQDPPIIVRVDDGAVLLDMRTIEPSADAHVAVAVRGALQELAAR